MRGSLDILDVRTARGPHGQLPRLYKRRAYGRLCREVCRGGTEVRFQDSARSMPRVSLVVGAVKSQVHVQGGQYAKRIREQGQPGKDLEASRAECDIGTVTDLNHSADMKEALPKGWS